MAIVFFNALLIVIVILVGEGQFRALRRTVGVVAVRVCFATHRLISMHLRGPGCQSSITRHDMACVQGFLIAASVN